jgi:hypothetical protein
LRLDVLIARPTMTVILSVPPPSSASCNSASHACCADVIVRSRSAMRSSDTCFVRPSLHSRCTCFQSERRRVTTGSACCPPIALDCILANGDRAADARVSSPWRASSSATV